MENLRTLEDVTTISICDEVLRKENIDSPSIVAALERQREVPKVSFFKTLFSDWIGRVDDQVEELHAIVQKVRKIMGEDTPIFLVVTDSRNSDNHLTS